MFAKLLMVDLTKLGKPYIEFAGGVDPLHKAVITDFVESNLVVVHKFHNSPVPVPDNLPNAQLVRQIVKFLEEVTDNLIFTDPINPYVDNIFNFYCHTSPKLRNDDLRNALRSMIPLFNVSDLTPVIDYGRFLAIALSASSMFDDLPNLYEHGLEGIHTGYGTIGRCSVRLLGTISDLVFYHPGKPNGCRRILALARSVDDPLREVAKVLVANNLSINHYTKVIAEMEERQWISTARFDDIKLCKIYRIGNAVKVVYQISGFAQGSFTCFLEDIKDIFSEPQKFDLDNVRDMVYLDIAVKSIRQLLRDMGNCDQPFISGDFLVTDLHKKLVEYYIGNTSQPVRHIYPRRRQVSRWLKHLGF